MYIPFVNKDMEIDEWVREVIDFHFSEATGSKFWLKKQKKLGIDVKKEVRSYNDIYKLGYFNEDDLANIPVEDIIPAAYKNSREGIRVFETGGTKGSPKRIFDYYYRKIGADWLSYILDLYKFPSSGNWLHIGPTGPHSIGYTVFLLSTLRNGIFYSIDMDPRWVKKIIGLKKPEIYDLYIEHICNQSKVILETQKIDFLFTTPKLLEVLWDRLELEKYNLQGILSGGTKVTRDMNKVFRKEVIKDVPLVYIYGNTLMGSAPQATFDKDGIWDLVYYPNYPFFVIDVVDFNDPQKIVGYEERGRVRMTSLNKDFFIPNLLERDEGVRIRGNEFFSWDGVADIRTCDILSDEIIEGIY